MLCALLVAGLALRIYMTEPLKKAKRHRGREVEILNHAIMQVVRVYGIKKIPSETYIEYGERTEKTLKDDSFAILQAIYSEKLYSNHLVDERPFRETYQRLYKGLPWQKRLQVVLWRIKKS